MSTLFIQGGNMKIGIDLGGSHIAIGLIDEGKIIKKYEHNFSNVEKENLEKVIKEFIGNTLDSILVDKIEIQMIGICAPRYIY